MKFSGETSRFKPIGLKRYGANQYFPLAHVPSLNQRLNFKPSRGRATRLFSRIKTKPICPTNDLPHKQERATSYVRPECNPLPRFDFLG